MILSAPLRLIGAALVGVWLAGTFVALLAFWRRSASAAGADLAKIARSAATEVVGRGSPLSPAVFNLSSLPIWWLGRELQLAGANDAYARAVGHPTSESAVLANAQIAPGARGLAAEARETERAVVGEERVLIDGTRHILEIIAIPLRGGEVAHLAFDETRRHAAQTAAAERARGLADLLDELAVATAWFDASTALRHASAPFARMFALDPDWLGTRPPFERVLDQMRAAGRLPEERDFAAWRASYRAWFETADTRFQASWTLPGGALIQVTGKPRDGGLLLVCEDYTERAQLVAARDGLLAVQAATLDQLREGVAVFGADGRLKSANRRFAEILKIEPDMLTSGLPAERLIDHIAGLLDQPERAKGLRDLIMHATVGRGAHRGQARSRLGYVIDFYAAPLPDGNALLTLSATEDRVSPIQ